MSFISDILGTTNSFQAKAPVNNYQAKLASLTQIPGLLDAIKAAQTQAITGAGAPGSAVDAGQTALAQMLTGQANGTGPSLAQAQLEQGTAENAAKAAGAVASARGLTPAQAARLALTQVAAGGQQMAGQAAQLRSQEQLGAEQQLGAALSAQRSGQVAGASAATNTLGTVGNMLGTQNQQAIQNLAQKQNIDAGVAAGNQGAAVQTNQTNAGVSEANQATNAKVVGGLLGGAGAALGLAHGGAVDEQVADVAGRAGLDDPRNDRIPITASPEEIVLPRSVTMSDNAPELAAAFVAGVKSSKKGGPSHGEMMARHRAIGARLAEIDHALSGGGAVPGYAIGGSVGPALAAFGNSMAGTDPLAAGLTSLGAGLHSYLTRPRPPTLADVVLNAGITPITGGAGLPGYADGGAVGGWGPYTPASLQGMADAAQAPPAPTVDPVAPGPVAPDSPLQAGWGPWNAQAVQSMGDAASAPAPSAMPPENVPLSVGAPPLQKFLTPYGAAADAAQVAANAPKPPAPAGGPSIPGGIQAGAALQSKGVREEAAARGAEGEATAAAIQKGQQDTDQIAKAFDAKRQELQSRLDTTRDAIMNGEIDPNHYWANRSTGQKVQGVIGLVLGGIGAGLTGGPNQALEVINNAISRDVDAQKTNQAKRLQMYGMDREDVRNTFSDEANLRARALASVTAQVEIAKSRAQGPEAKARADQLIGALKTQTAQLVQDSALKAGQGEMQRMQVQQAREAMDLRNKLFSGQSTPMDMERAAQLGVIDGTRLVRERRDDGSVQYHMAATADDASKVKDALAARDDMKQVVGEARGLMKEVGSLGAWSATNKAKAEGLRARFIGSAKTLAAAGKLPADAFQAIQDTWPNLAGTHFMGGDEQKLNDIEQWAGSKAANVLKTYAH